MAGQSLGNESGQMKLKLCGIALAACLLSAQTPPPMSFTATTMNVAGAPDAIRIDILRWSTEAERDRLMAAWNLKAEPAGRGGRGSGRAGGRAGRGAAAPAGAAAPRDDAPPPTPEGSLTNALQQTTTVGYLWSSEVAGYALRYAGKLNGSDGLDRIILITSRRLGAMNDLWKSTRQGQPTTYAFSVIELRVNAKGEGEGKVSLTGKIAPDSEAKMLTVENYDTLPIVLGKLRKSQEHTGL
jgi:hypothetical protein